jgi:hypothetical protein
MKLSRRQMLLVSASLPLLGISESRGRIGAGRI